MKKIELKEMANISDKFIGEQNGQSKSIIVLYMSSLNIKNNEESILSIFSSNIAKSSIKFIEDRIILDIFFNNHLHEDLENLFTNMEIYKILLGQNEERIINKISFVLNDDLKSEQLIFIDPIYFTKFANRAGGRINGIRLLYDFRNIMYVPEFLDENFINEIKDLWEGEDE